MKRDRLAPFDPGPERILRSEPESELARLVRAAQDQSALPEVTLARVVRRVRRAPVHVRARRRGLKLATIGVVLLLGIGVGVAATLVSVGWSPVPVDQRPAAGAGWGSRARRWWHARGARPAVSATTALTAEADLDPVVERESSVAIDGRAPSEADRAASVEAPRPTQLRGRPAPTAVTTSPTLQPEPVPAQDPPASATGSEAAVVAQALRLLGAPGTRAEGVELLRAYVARGGQARFRADAEVALATALVASGRAGEAARLTAEVVARDGADAPIALRLLRAELAMSTRCQEALGELEALVPQLEGHALAARALYDRGVARLRCGEPAAGRSDLERVIARDPGSARAAAARQELAR